jgi:hypothetical protein
MSTYIIILVKSYQSLEEPPPPESPPPKPPPSELPPEEPPEPQEPPDITLTPAAISSTRIRITRITKPIITSAVSI